MASQNDPKAETAPTAAPVPLHVQSDDLLARFLGRDLQTATLRGALGLVVVCVVLATIAALVG